ncbi:MAG TPA: hypothetical protein VL334_16400 [Anaerolineae bacterium]|nr:hypothetical protein [Anaerolineae bacterium]
MQAMQRSHSTKAFAACLAVVVVLSISYFLVVDRAPLFNGDESGWISAGFHYADLLLSGDFSREVWECRDCGAWGSLNPHLGKLLIGVPLALFADARLNGALANWMFDPPWLVLPFVVGVVHCLRRVVRSTRDKSADLLIVPLSFFVVNYVFILALLTMNWPRYYLPTVIAGSFLIAIGASALLTELVRWVHGIANGEKAQRLPRVSPRVKSMLFGALPWLLVLLFAGLSLSYAAREGINDDAFITYRVARNLAGGLGPVFNPGERVLTITTPGYMLLLAATSVFSQDFVALAMLWNGLAMLALGALLIDASQAGREQRTAALAALAAMVAVTLTLSNTLFRAAVGMETPLYLAALLAVFAAYRRTLAQPASSQRWLLATASAAAVAFLIRPDGLLAGLVVGIHWLVTQRRIPWRALALGLLLALPWVLFAWGYYGSPLPNTLAAKITQGLPDPEGQWGRQLWEVGGSWIAANPLAAALALVGLAATVWPASSPRPAELRVRRLMLLWAALYVAIHVALRVRGYFWYYLPLLPVAALLAGDGAAGVVRWLARLRQRGQPWRVVQPWLVAGLVAVLFAPVLTETSKLIGPRLPGQRQMAYERTGLVLRELCQHPGHEPVGMTEIGIIGYVSDCHVLDFSGLLQPEIAHLRLSPVDKIAWAIKSYAPPLLVLAGSTGYPRNLADQLWFRQRYEPVDIQDERGFLSVIHRQAMGPMEQRELASRWWQQVEPTTDPLTTTLVFPLDVTPAITLHTFLPADSGLAVAANGQPVVTLTGAAPVWQDAPLTDVQAVDGAVTLELTGLAPGQPAALAWVESNAIPSVHYFKSFEEAAAQPRPNLQLELDDRVQATLAPSSAGSLALDVAYRDLPGVQLAVFVDGQQVGVAGSGTGVWQVARFELPAGALTGQPTVDVELRNLAQQFVRVYYAALVDPARPPYQP